MVEIPGVSSLWLCSSLKKVIEMNTFCNNFYVARPQTGMVLGLPQQPD